MAQQMIDIALDNDGDEILDSTGDLILAESTLQHQKQLLNNAKGDFKDNPTVCVGIDLYLDDEGPNDLIRAAAVEFGRDGMTVNKIAYSGGKIVGNAYYG